METVNIRLPEEQLRMMDKEVKRRHFPSRSEYVREALRRMREEALELSDETVSAIKTARKQRGVPAEKVFRELGI
ncbi:MAG: ribbon-helix-helix domain-containing protein [Candidatus Altiarchaeota archaeon]